jgi:signal transduction histidine kinase
MLAPPRKWLVLVGAAGLLVLTQLRDPEQLDLGSRVFPFGFLALAWAVGTMVHNRQRIASSLADRAQRLEAEQELVAHAAVLDERVRIARELHDVVAHSVSVMVIQAVAGRKTLAAGRDGADGAFEAIEATGQQALTEMRRLLGVLRHVEDAPQLVPQPGLNQLAALVERAREAGLGVDLAIEGAVRPLSPGTDLSAYRILQEALTNVIKHAPGAQTTVRVRYGERDVTLDVADTGGAGAASPPISGGHGIVGMRERAALYGGTLHAGPRDGGGFAVRVRLPIEAA